MAHLLSLLYLTSFHPKKRAELQVEAPPTPHQIQNMMIILIHRLRIDYVVIHYLILNPGYSLMVCLKRLVPPPRTSLNTMNIICLRMAGRAHCPNLPVPLAKQACYCCQ